MEKSTNDNPPKRLLERLRSPLLNFASEIPQTPNPRSHLSLVSRRVAQEIENLSRGRFSLAKDQDHFCQTPSQYARFKIYDHVCGHYSWLTLPQMVTIRQLDRWCCHCGEPMSFEHIGPTLEDVQRFVEIRSGGKTFFSRRNTLEGQDMSDVFLFNCLNPCRGLLYETPFTWFLRESSPATSFSDLVPPTCGCPSCAHEMIAKEAAKKDCQ